MWANIMHERAGSGHSLTSFPVKSTNRVDREVNLRFGWWTGRVIQVRAVLLRLGEITRLVTALNWRADRGSEDLGLDTLLVEYLAAVGCALHAQDVRVVDAPTRSPGRGGMEMTPRQVGKGRVQPLGVRNPVGRDVGCLGDQAIADDSLGGVEAESCWARPLRREAMRTRSRRSGLRSG